MRIDFRTMKELSLKNLEANPRMIALLEEVCATTGAEAAALVTSDCLCVATHESRTVAPKHNVNQILVSADAVKIAMMTRTALRLHDDHGMAFQASKYAGGGSGLDNTSTNGGQPAPAYKPYDTGASSQDSIRSNNLVGFVPDNNNLFAVMAEEQHVAEWKSNLGFRCIVVETTERLLDGVVVVGPRQELGSSSSNVNGSVEGSVLLVRETEAALFVVTQTTSFSSS